MNEWIGTVPKICTICRRSLSGLPVFIDGQTYDGRWAIMCLSCHEAVGTGLGLDQGQKYSLLTLEKIEG